MNYLSQSWLINRRHALKALGSFIFSLPMLECMVPLRAAEEQTATPKRSAFIYLANGVHSLNYQILKEGKEYQFSRSLKPLEKHREVITPISGLHHPGALSHHHGCINVWLTGGKMGPSDRNTISVDQKMAEITAQQTRVASMEIALMQSSLAWTADGVQLPALRRCSEIFASLFEQQSLQNSLWGHPYAYGRPGDLWALTSSGNDELLRLTGHGFTISVTVVQVCMMCNLSQSEWTLCARKMDR